ncbi:DUF1847 domain-containing protein [Methanocella conradii]|nr:DUF1847 domain-containing protein [Methanocella conradii]
MVKVSLECSKCNRQACWSNAPNSGPMFCPTKTQKETIDEVLRLYKEDPEIRKMAIAAARTEGRSYKKLGIATCIGLIAESRTLTKILEVKGFEAISVCCKCGAIPREEIGLLDSEKAIPGTFEPICNPVAQARLLDAGGSKFMSWIKTKPELVHEAVSNPERLKLTEPIPLA